MNSKRIICFLLTVLLLLLFSSIIPAMANNNITVKIDGQQIIFDVQPQLINNRTMVPLRAIFESLGATIEWNGDTQTVTSTRGTTTISLTINSTKMYVNGESKTLDTPACLVGGRTLVPVRAISEAFGTTVTWDGATSTVIISTNNNINAYNYLKTWLLENGEINGARIGLYIRFRDLQISDFGDYFSIMYEANSDSIFFSIASPISENESRSGLIALKDGTNEYSYVSIEKTESGEITHAIGGSIKAPYYGLKAPLAYDIYEGPKIHESEFSEMSRAMIECSVICFNNFLALHVPELNISDFGFTCFE